MVLQSDKPFRSEPRSSEDAIAKDHGPAPNGRRAWIIELSEGRAQIRGWKIEYVEYPLELSWLEVKSLSCSEGNKCTRGTLSEAEALENVYEHATASPYSSQARQQIRYARADKAVITTVAELQGGLLWLDPWQASSSCSSMSCEQASASTPRSLQVIDSILRLDLNGISMLHALDPPLRRLSFSDEDACKNHVRLLRKAWRRFPPKQSWENACTQEGSKRVECQRNSCIEFMKIFANNRDDLDKYVFMINRDDKDTHSEWRKAIYYRWSHLWADISGFIEEIHPVMGHWHHPDLEMEEPMPYGELVIQHENRDNQAKWMHWHKNILMAPAFFDKNVKIRVHRQPVPGEGPSERYPYAGTWTKDMLWDVWYIRSDVELRMEVIDLRDSSKARTGTAAVFVFARLCKNYRTMTTRDAASALLKYAQEDVNMGNG